MSALHDLIARGNDCTTLRELLEEGENPNATDVRGNTPLHIAVIKEIENAQEFEANLKVVRELIYFAADVNYANNLGNTPLHFAIGVKKYKMMEILLKCNAKIDLQDSFGNSALHYAINNRLLLLRATDDWHNPAYFSHSDLDAVKLLLKYNPNINIFNNSFETPLIWAVKEKNFQIVQILLKKEALVSLRDLYNNGALHHALNQIEINIKIVTELLRYGSSHAPKNDQGESPIDVYLRRLYSASSTEQEKAKHLFKLFVFQNNSFKNKHFREIAVISRMKKSLLCPLFWYCRYEIEQMKSDELTVNYTVYDLAKWGFFSGIYAAKAPEYDIFYIVLDKLKRGEYTVYCDMIISGVCQQYLSTKTAEFGYWVNRRGEREEFLNFDTRYYICYYLTNFEMFNLMLAFSSSNSFLKICKICCKLYEN